MPERIPTPCNYPLCPELTTQRYCPKHRKPAKDPRAAAARRGYDKAWARLRRRYAAANPWCEDPYGTHPVRIPGEIVDHKIAIRDGGPRLEWSNLQHLCRSCHGKKTREETEARRAR